MRLLLLSDLHAQSKKDPGGQDAKLLCDDFRADVNANPLLSLIESAKSSEEFSCDYIVCAGDMTNRASPDGVRFVWEKLHDLKNTTGAKDVFATVGNHDVSSRPPEKNDAAAIAEHQDTFPRENLMRLALRFPSASEEKSDKYWSHGYYLERLNGFSVNVLIINSCWLHENHTDLYRGSITSYTLEKIRHDLSALSAEDNIGLTILHHHPHQHSELSLGSDDVMRNGQKLIDLLNENGEWLIIHGHKHHPKFVKAAGQIGMPFVMACGSFSGQIGGANASVSRNFLHRISIDVAKGLKGVVETWAWLDGLGWKKEGTADNKFPKSFGFGFDGDLRALARSIETDIGGQPAKKWIELQKTFPETRYLLPDEIRLLRRHLERLGLQFSGGDNSALAPYEVGRKMK